MKSDRTVHLDNLPTRPHSTTNFIRLLLKILNPENEYIVYKRPLPSHDLNDTIDQAKDHLLDSKWGIVEISRSRAMRLRHQAFIAFADHELAGKFIRHWSNGKLVIAKKKIQIERAYKESLLGLAWNHPGAARKALHTRNKLHKLRTDVEAREHKTLNRLARRIRFKLRNKNSPLLDEEQIQTIVDRALSERRGKGTAQNAEIKKLDTFRAPEIKKSSLRSNPPSTTLLVQNLPEDFTPERLKQHFQNAGLKEVRHVPVKNLAFIEYDKVEYAQTQKLHLADDEVIMNLGLIIDFAK